MPVFFVIPRVVFRYVLDGIIEHLVQSQAIKSFLLQAARGLPPENVPMGESVGIVISGNAFAVLYEGNAKGDDDAPVGLQIDLHHEAVWEVFGPVPLAE